MPAGGTGRAFPRLREHERAGAQRDLGGFRAPSSAARTATPAGRRPRPARARRRETGVDRVGVDDRREDGARDGRTARAAPHPTRPHRAGTAASARRCPRRTTWTPASRASSHDAMSPYARSSTRSTWSSTHRSLVAGNVASSSSPVRSRTISAWSAERGARCVGAPVLPHDRRVHRPAPSRAFPDHERLGLVRDPQRRHILRAGERLGQRARDRPFHRGRDRLRVLLHEPRGRERGLHRHRRDPALAQLLVERPRSACSTCPGRGRGRVGSPPHRGVGALGERPAVRLERAAVLALGLGRAAPPPPAPATPRPRAAVRSGVQSSTPAISSAAGPAAAQPAVARGQGEPGAAREHVVEIERALVGDTWTASARGSHRRPRAGRQARAARRGAQGARRQPAVRKPAPARGSEQRHVGRDRRARPEVAGGGVDGVRAMTR